MMRWFQGLISQEKRWAGRLKEAVSEAPNCRQACELRMPFLDRQVYTNLDSCAAEVPLLTFVLCVYRVMMSDQHVALAFIKVTIILL